MTDSIKAVDLWRVEKLLQFLNEALGEEPEGTVTQKEIQQQEEVKLLIPAGVYGPCWIGQAMHLSHISKVRMRNGIRYTISKAAIQEALEGIRAARARQAKPPNGQGEDGIKATGGGQSENHTPLTHSHREFRSI